MLHYGNIILIINELKENNFLYSINQHKYFKFTNFSNNKPITHSMLNLNLFGII